MATDGVVRSDVSGHPDPRIQEALERFTQRQRQDLLLFLTSPAHVRADLIRQCFEREDARHVGEMLIDFEEDDFVRAAFVEALRRMEAAL